LKGKVKRESLPIALGCFIETLCRNAVQPSEIRIENDPVAADRIDQRF